MRVNEEKKNAELTDDGMLCFDVAVHFRNMCFDIDKFIVYLRILELTDPNIRQNDFNLFIHEPQLLTSLSCFFHRTIVWLTCFIVLLQHEKLGGKHGLN